VSVAPRAHAETDVASLTAQVETLQAELIKQLLAQIEELKAQLAKIQASQQDDDVDVAATTSLAITNPNTGAVYVGEPLSITWKSYGIPTNQNVYLYWKSDLNVEGYIATSTPNDGAYTWDVPKEMASDKFDYKVFVRWYGPTGSYVEDGSDQRLWFRHRPSVPVIDDVRAKAGDSWVLYSGERAFVYGSGLLGNLTIKLVPVENVSVVSTSDAYIEFLVPDVSEDEGINFRITNNTTGQTSKTHAVKLMGNNSDR
jgi:hypothetical protein